MHAHRQRLDQRTGLAGKVGRQAVQQVGRHVDQLGEGAVVHQPGEGEVLAEVVLALLAEPALAAVLAGIGGHQLAGLETADTCAEGDDLAAEFMAEDALALEAGERMGAIGGNEHRTGQVLVQVGAADAAPVHADLHPAGLRAARPGDLFQADVLAAVPYRGLHRQFLAHLDNPCCRCRGGDQTNTLSMASSGAG
ncbi:hypothetical protein D3C84_773410 [compost metagenome]